MKTLLIALILSVPVVTQTQSATVVFYNSPNTYLEVSYRIPGYLDNSEVAHLKRNQYCSVQVEPGKHTVRSKDKNRALMLTVEPGKTYYVRVELKHGGFALTNVWLATLIDPQQAERDIAGYDKVAAVRSDK
ncbi:MAG: DUF2846 domain-containing protein [Candidatus Solibacter sp.]|jgi:hypothetical protein